MRKYELTERGKMVIAIVLVLIVLVSSTIFAVRALDFSPANAPRQGLDSLLPSGGDFNPSGDGAALLPAPEVESDSTPAPTPTPTPEPQTGSSNGDGETEQYIPAVTGPVGFSRAAGTLSFLFTPHLQDAVDADTVSLMGELLASPRNTPESQIVVEIPQLTRNETAALTSAIAEAFSTHGVARRDLVFNTFQPAPGEETFEINIFFQVRAVTGTK